MTRPFPVGPALKTKATLLRKPASAGEGSSGGTSKPSSRDRRCRFFASCSAYGTPGSVQPPQTPKCLQCRLLDLEELDLEHQRGVRRDHAAGAAGAVTHRRRNRQDACAADLHACDAFIPAGDHLLRAQRKVEWLIAVFRAVELVAPLVGTARVVEPAGVVHAHQPAVASLGAAADFHILLLQLRDAGVSHWLAL